MLVELRVHDFVLIDSLELRLEPGYNVLTGETGAGKSIVIGALALALGGRARADVVRPGAREAVVEALFDVSEHRSLGAQLADMGIACDGELVIRRIVQAGGRSRAYLNGRLCAVSELSQLAHELADITSQHESVALADSTRHLDYLDRYAGLEDAKSQLAAMVDELTACTAELRALFDREAGRAEREEFLRYRIAAIRELAPKPGEPDDLRAESARLKHAERLRDATARVAASLDAEQAGVALDHGRSGAGDRLGDRLCDRLGKLIGELRAAAELDPALAPMASELDACWERLREIARAAARYAERIESDPQRLDELQERIFQLEALLRQHGPTVRDVLEAERRMQHELDELAGIETRLPELTAVRDRLLGRAGTSAQQLSRARKRAAGKLAAAISGQLAELGMGAARVLVDVSRASGDGAELVVDGARLGRDGIDRVQFLIATARGMEPRPLGRIASGGELSRALLALKGALGTLGDGARSVQIFDEVDAGVGGETADRIGRAIAAIARGRQVLCITHLASIAAYADAHFVVEKREGDSSTTSLIRRVEGSTRVAELARMLTGAKASGSSAKAARELLESAQRPVRAA